MAATFLAPLALAAVLSTASPAAAYSVLTHEAVIDSVWEDSLRPALLARFPKATSEELRKAHAHAYGGVIVQDMGYYPFGTHFFSDLTHYVRSGDFIEALLDEATTLDEYAFALGALAHYPGDTNGHPDATNRAVPLIYPKLRAKYGDEVSYLEDPIAHIRAEFGFDVLQVARGRYVSDHYHDFIGFEVAEPLLDRALRRTYGLGTDDIIDHADLAIGSYRFSVKSLVPEATEAAWDLKKDEIARSNPGITRDRFVYSMTRASYENEWGKKYREPSRSAKILAAFVRVLPKIGPLESQNFRPPTPEAEKLYLDSFDRTVAAYRILIAQVRRKQLELRNLNFDLGEPTRIGQYALADQAYEKWLRKLRALQFRSVTPEIRRDILAFYAADPAAPNPRDPESSKASRRSIRDAQGDIARLRAVTAAGENVASTPSPPQAKKD